MLLLATFGSCGAILLYIAAAAGAADLPPNWPPDPSRYDKPGTEVAPGLKVGDELNASNAAVAKGLLPPEVLSHYQKGEYVNPIDSWPTGLIKWDDSFEASTKANAGRYAVDPKTFTIIEKATGKPPEYVYGNRKFSWKNELLNTYQVYGYLNHPAPLPDGSGYEWFWSSQSAWQCAENVKANRATLAGLREDFELPFDRRVHHNVSQVFDIQTLSRFGK